MPWTIFVILTVLLVSAILALSSVVKNLGGLHLAYVEMVDSIARPGRFSLAAAAGLATLASLLLLVQFACALR